MGAIQQLLLAEVAGVTPATVSFAGSLATAAGDNPHTFSSVGFGTAAASRKIIVAVAQAASATTVTGLTIGGVTASLVIDQAGTTIHGSLWQASVPTGTSGNIVVTWAGAPGTRCGVIAYALYNAASSASATSGSAADPGSTTLNCLANGVIIAAASSSDGPNSWAGVTVDVDETIGGAPYTQTGASQAFSAAQTGLTITNTYNASPGNRVMMCAAWGPG